MLALLREWLSPGSGVTPHTAEGSARVTEDKAWPLQRLGRATALRGSVRRGSLVSSPAPVPDRDF